MRHREAVYAFPPPRLLSAVVARALADRALGIFVVPLSVTAPVWRKLLAASVLGGSDGYIRVRRAQRLLLGPALLTCQDLAIFPCDFGRLRGCADGWVDPGCAGAFRRRPRPPCGSSADAADRLQLRSAIPHEARLGNGGGPVSGAQ